MAIRRHPTISMRGIRAPTVSTWSAASNSSVLGGTSISRWPPASSTREVSGRQSADQCGRRRRHGIGDARIRDAETGVPKNKMILNGRYDMRRLVHRCHRYALRELSLQRRQRPGVATANGNIDQVFSPETYVDVGIAYAGFESLRAGSAWSRTCSTSTRTSSAGQSLERYQSVLVHCAERASGRFLQAGLELEFLIP